MAKIEVKQITVVTEFRGIRYTDDVKRWALVDMLDRTEKVIPSLTPESFVDEQPLMKPIKFTKKQS